MMNLKRCAIILIVCLLSACGPRTTLEKSKQGAQVEATAPEMTNEQPTPLETEFPPEPGVETATAEVTDPATLPPAESASPSPSPSEPPTPDASPSPFPSETPSDNKKPPRSDEQKKADFEKLKADLLDQHTEVSDVGVVGDLVVQVNKKIDSTDIVGDSYASKRANGVFRFLYVGVSNAAKKAKTIDSSMFTLVAADGTTYEADSTAGIYAKVDQRFFLEKLNPGVEAYGYIVFDMPPDVKFRNVVLHVQNGSDHVDLKFRKA